MLGNAGDSVDSVYSGLVVYAARLKWQGLVANPWFATFGVGDAGYCWYCSYSGICLLHRVCCDKVTFFMGDIWSLRYYLLSLCYTKY